MEIEVSYCFIKDWHSRNFTQEAHRIGVEKADKCQNFPPPGMCKRGFQYDLIILAKGRERVGRKASQLLRLLQIEWPNKAN